MQSVSDDDVWKRLLEKPCFELAAKGGSNWEDVRCFLAASSYSLEWILFIIRKIIIYIFLQRYSAVGSDTVI